MSDACCTSARKRCSLWRSSSSASSFSFVARAKSTIVIATPSAARNARPCTRGSSMSDGTSPVAIATSPTARQIVLSTMAGTTLRNPHSRMQSTAPKHSPIASVGPQPIAYITIVLPPSSTPMRVHSRHPEEPSGKTTARAGGEQPRGDEHRDEQPHRLVGDQSELARAPEHRDHDHQREHARIEDAAAESCAARHRPFRVHSRAIGRTRDRLETRTPHLGRTARNRTLRTAGQASLSPGVEGGPARSAPRGRGRPRRTRRR